MDIEDKQHLTVSTKTAFLSTRLLSTPFWALFNLLTIILYKEMHITPWMVTTMIVIKPASALFASYWSNWIHGRSDRLVSNLVWANILRYIPFIFAPWIDSPWLFIAAFGFYMMMSRGVIPAWMEIFKQNLESSTRSRLFTYGSALDYLGTTILPIGMGLILDDYSHSWKILISLSAFIGLFSTFFLLKLPSKIPATTTPPFSLKEEFLKPWVQAFELMRQRKDFSSFICGFMLGGAGLMVMQPVIPEFFVDVLNLSYTKMFVAMAACKAIGYAAASPGWLKLFHSWNIFTFCGSVSLIAAGFPLLIIASQFYPEFIYAAYILYGVMQAGSELGWHMSGPVFAKEKESSIFSMTNVLSVGVRGCFTPLLGFLFFTMAGSTVTLYIGSALCALSFVYLLLFRHPEYEPV